MSTMKVLFFFVCCLVGTHGFPQGFETDAETVEPTNTGGGVSEGDIPIIIIRRRPIFFGSGSHDGGSGFNLFNLLTSILNSRTPSFSPDVGANPESNSTTNGTSLFPSLFPSLFGGFNPSFGPDFDTNSTYDVTYEDGHKVETNRTVGGNGDVFFTRVFMNIVPVGGSDVGDGDGAGEVTVVQEDPAINQVENEFVEDFS